MFLSSGFGKFFADATDVVLGSTIVHSYAIGT